MENVTIKDIVEVTGGVLLCGDENKEIREFSIDSREGSEDSIFVPIIGERVDAHRFIEGALSMGYGLRSICRQTRRNRGSRLPPKPAG